MSRLACTTDTPAGQSKIVALKSEFNSSVTLLTLENFQSTTSGVKEEDFCLPITPRRSKRAKLEPTTPSLLWGRLKREHDDIPDLEDLKSNIITPPRSLRKTEAESTTTLLEMSPLSSAPSSPEPTRKGKGKAKGSSKDETDAEFRLSSGTRSAMTSPTKKKVQKAIPQALSNPHPAPEHWKEVYEIIHKMREGIMAPVDTMGCAQAQYRETEPKNQRFATLVSLMLSSQTKDEVTDAAVGNLRKSLGGAVTIDGIINAEPSLISEAICKVGFWRRKTGYLKEAAVKLRDEFHSDVPKTVDELCSLPGVGPKMAFLCLQAAWNLNHGIGVDVHVHRITNRLGWHRKPTKNPEETRLNLQSWLPKEYHADINTMLVGFGQVICTSVNPNCDRCALSVNYSTEALCPSSRQYLAEKKRKAGTKRKLATISTAKDESGEYDDVKPSTSGLTTVKIELETDHVEVPSSK